MKTNYHTHTYRCNHAAGNEEDYVQAAIKNGYHVLGFSDHTPWPYRNKDFIPNIRMRMEEFEDYLNSVREMKEKYKDQIQIFCGVEAESFPEYYDWLAEQLNSGKLDYAILGNHYPYSEELGKSQYFGNCIHTKKTLDLYLECMLKGINSGLFKVIAHPDLFCRTDGSFDECERLISEKICEAAKKKDCILELNISGFAMKYRNEGYPSVGFWKIAAEKGNKVILGIDAHRPSALMTDQFRNQGLKLAEELNLNLIDHIEI